MRITVNYTFSDYYEAQKLVYKTSKQKWLIRALGIILTVNTVLLLLITGIDAVTVLFSILAVCFMLYPQTFLRIFSYRMYKGNNNFNTPTHMEINEKGITAKTENTTGIFKWDAFVKYKIDNKMIALYKTSLFFTPISRRNVRSDKEWEELTELIKKNIPA